MSLLSQHPSSEIRKITIMGGASVLNVQEERTTTKRSTTRRRRIADEIYEARVTPSTITKITVDTGIAAPTAPAAAPAAVASPAAPMQKGGAPAAASGAAVNTDVKQIQIVRIEESAPAPTDASAGADTAAAPVAPHGKIILSGKKPKHMKIVLTKKNHGLAAPQPMVADSASAHRPRKVTLGLQHLKRRVTKARRLQRILKATPIEQIRKELVAAKIIKPDSKAPEAIIRQMYSDAKIVSTKSL
jgi:hypothetical protein